MTMIQEELKNIFYQGQTRIQQNILSIKIVDRDNRWLYFLIMSIPANSPAVIYD